MKTSFIIYNENLFLYNELMHSTVQWWITLRRLNSVAGLTNYPNLFKRDFHDDFKRKSRISREFEAICETASAPNKGPRVHGLIDEKN
jgi:hypothetical protein